MSRDHFLIVLPARYGSTRFPGKPLVSIAGKPLIEWVYRRAQEIRGAGELVVATDDGRIADAVKAFGGNAVMTAGDHVTGTDRVAEVARSLSYPFVVNLQGDEPVFDPRMVEAMVERLMTSPDRDIVTACHRIESPDDYHNPNVVKVVVDAGGRALYFSRTPVPNGAALGSKPGKTSDPTSEPVASPSPASPPYRHIGIYAYKREALLRFTSLDPTGLERAERLEQLRALENGMTIDVVVTDSQTLGVDVPEDVKKVEKELGRIYTDRYSDSTGPAEGVAGSDSDTSV
jgi:3-deoxy-manno-octulosonate cytidylyltransferase (CMP-KDO synthetase)